MVIKKAATADKFPTPTSFKALTRFSNLSINSSFSLSIKLFIIADPAAEKIRHKREINTILSGGTPKSAITIPVKPVRATLSIIFGLDKDIIALKYFMN
jgi:hypothetical protein